MEEVGQEVGCGRCSLCGSRQAQSATLACNAQHWPRRFGEARFEDPVKRLPVNFLETVGLECAVWPHAAKTYVRSTDKRRLRRELGGPGEGECSVALRRALWIGGCDAFNALFTLSVLLPADRGYAPGEKDILAAACEKRRSRRRQSTRAGSGGRIRAPRRASWPRRGAASWATARIRTASRKTRLSG